MAPDTQTIDFNAIFINSGQALALHFDNSAGQLEFGGGETLSVAIKRVDPDDDDDDDDEEEDEEDGEDSDFEEDDEDEDEEEDEDDDDDLDDEEEEDDLKLI